MLGTALPGSGFNPYWGQTLCFRILVPELALLRFVVKDYDWKSRNDFIGQYTLPWSCMQQGEMVLPLPAHTPALAVFLMLSSPPSNHPQVTATYTCSPRMASAFTQLPSLCTSAHRKCQRRLNLKAATSQAEWIHWL